MRERPTRSPCRNTRALVELLIERDADVSSLKNSMGRTASNVAQKKPSTLKLVEEARAKRLKFLEERRALIARKPESHTTLYGPEEKKIRLSRGSLLA